MGARIKIFYFIWSLCEYLLNFMSDLGYNGKHNQFHYISTAIWKNFVFDDKIQIRHRHDKCVYANKVVHVKLCI